MEFDILMLAMLNVRASVLCNATKRNIAHCRLSLQTWTSEEGEFSYRLIDMLLPFIFLKLQK